MELNNAVLSALISGATTLSIISYGYGRLQQKIQDLSTKVKTLEGKVLILQSSDHEHSTWQKVTDAKLEEKFQKIFEALTEIKENIKRGDNFRSGSTRTG